jgi:hypothetical protein
VSDRLHDALDEAIDRVANRLVSVKDDPFAARRIVDALPERRQGKWWSISSLAVQAAAIAAVVLAIGYLRSSPPGERLSTDGRPRVAVREQTAPVPATIPAVERPPVAAADAVLVRRRVVQRAAPAQPAFGLAEIGAPDEIVIPTLVATKPLPPIDPASITPISISELPLGGESSPPFSKE